MYKIEIKTVYLRKKNESKPFKEKDKILYYHTDNLYSVIGICEYEKSQIISNYCADIDIYNKNFYSMIPQNNNFFDISEINNMLNCISNEGDGLTATCFLTFKLLKKNELKNTVSYPYWKGEPLTPYISIKFTITKVVDK